ncbi:hypothetical protein Pla163_30280 [Planctomycetes bacterium Pla163]|uniref:Response regulatory domain-containing protein n=1 Tax=Rohdeia mirabilis TaxID=2528008 RepID=A0A518D320_9BACT|nr:hypothetical protein Pla163_30280 [Planctomycetes bacterium Pla163]
MEITPTDRQLDPVRAPKVPRDAARPESEDAQADATVGAESVAGPQPGGFTLRPQPRHRARNRELAVRRACRVLPLKDEQGLGNSLVRLLDQAIPELHFRVGEHGPVDWIWVCGFESEDLERVRSLREAHPDAQVLVTGRRMDPGSLERLAEVGVDLALPWPLPLQALRSHLVERG